MKNNRTTRTTPADRHIVQFRDVGLEAPLAARVSNGRGDEQSIHLVARRDLLRYYDLLSEGLRRIRLTEAEASLIVDLLNGTILDGGSASMLWAEIEDGVRMDDLDKKWKLDGAALLAKVRAWGPTESMAVIDATERYWSGRADDEPLADGLKRVGLVKAG